MQNKPIQSLNWMTNNIVDVQIKSMELLLFLLKGEIRMHEKTTGNDATYFERRIDTAFSKLDEIKTMIKSVSNFMDESIDIMKTSASREKVLDYKARYNQEKAALTKMLKHLKALNFEYDMYQSGYRDHEIPADDEISTSRYNWNNERHEEVDITKRLT